MNARQKLHQAQLQEWASRLAEQKAQGLTNKELCKQNNISIHSYNYWKRLLKEELVDQMLPDIVPLSLPIQSGQPLDTPHTLHTINCTNRTNCTTYKLSINGFEFELDSNISPEFLCSLLKAVRHA